MNQQYDDTNTGVLFKEDKEGKKPNYPDYTGKINVEGVEKRLAGWVKDTDKGKILSLRVSDFREKQAAPTRAVEPDKLLTESEEEDLSAIPF